MGDEWSSGEVTMRRMDTGDETSVAIEASKGTLRKVFTIQMPENGFLRFDLDFNPNSELRNRRGPS